MSKQRIGFIGLGIMGKPMAKNLINGGFHLTVHDLLRALTPFLVDRGFSIRDNLDNLLYMLSNYHL